MDLIRDFGETAIDFALKPIDFALKPIDFALKPIDFALKHGAHGVLRMTREEFLFRDAQENDIARALASTGLNFRSYHKALPGAGATAMTPQHFEESHDV